MPDNSTLIRGITKSEHKTATSLLGGGRASGGNLKSRSVAFFKTCRNISLEFLFPAKCVICRKPLGWSNPEPVCSSCSMKIRSIEEPICFTCGYPILAEIGNVPKEKITCTSCKKNVPKFTQTRSVFYYEGTLRQLVHSFKYQGKITIGKMLAQSMGDYCRDGSYFPTAECIVPVPLGIKKLRHREFNQSLILAKVVGKYLKVPVYPFALKKVKEPAPQMQLSRQARMRNVRGAFMVRNKKQINQKEVLLVDDVFTTGATIRECSRVLLQHGVKKVWALTLARTILN